MDAFPIMSHFVLNGSMKIAPTAYSFGISMDQIPSVKLGIVTKPYLADTKSAIKAILAVGEAFNVDVVPLLSRIESLFKHCPSPGTPYINVISFDFYPEERCDITIYCRL